MTWLCLRERISELLTQILLKCSVTTVQEHLLEQLFYIKIH